MRALLSPSRRPHPGISRNSLGVLCGLLGSSIDEAHTALHRILTSLLAATTRPGSIRPLERKTGRVNSVVTFAIEFGQGAMGRA